MIQFNIKEESIQKAMLEAAAQSRPVVSVKDRYGQLYVGYLTGIGGYHNDAVTFERWVGPDLRYYEIPIKSVVRMNILSQTSQAIPEAP